MNVSQADQNDVKVRSFAAATQVDRVPPEDALAIFDALEPVETNFMIGAWKGEGFETGHTMDGMLERCHWHGKRFESLEHVHPLVFRKVSGTLTSVRPLLVMPGMGLLEKMPSSSRALSASCSSGLCRCCPAASPPLACA